MEAFSHLPTRNTAWPTSPGNGVRTHPLQWAALLALPALVAVLYLDILLFVMPFLSDALPARFSVMPAGDSYMTADSPSYINFDTQRPIGYPVFIWAMKTVLGSYHAVIQAQLVLFCLSVAVLGHAVLRLTGALLPALALELIVVGHTGPIGLYDQIMSDSLATSLAALFMAAAIYALRTRSLGAFIALCATLAVAVTIRPINLVLVVPVLAVAWLSAGGEGRTLLARSALAGAVTVIAVLATPVTHLALHGRADSSSPLERGLIQKVMFSRDVVSSPTQACDATFINTQIAPVLDHIEGAPSSTTAWLLKRKYTDYLRFRVIIPGLVDRHGFQTRHQTNPILLCYTINAARRFPQALAAGIWEEYWKLLGNGTFITAAQKEEYDAYLAIHPPVLPPAYPKMPSRETTHDAGTDDAADTGFVEFAFNAPKTRPPFLILGLKFIQYGAWVLSLAAIVAVLFGRIRRSAFGLLLSVMAVAGLTFHLTVAATAVVEMALSRYIFVLWPEIATIWIVAAVLVLSWALSWRGSR
jgi:hypothetical protein